MVQSQAREFGIIGLGRMGGGLAMQALEKGFRVVGLTIGGAPAELLQAIGEGVDLLERYRDKLDITGVLECWRHGSVIRSWLIDLMHEAYVENGGLGKIAPFVEDTGEVNWLLDDALHMEVPTPVIAMAAMQLFTSRDDCKTWARAIATMRHGFGGHPYGPSEPIAEERQTGRIAGFVRD